MENIKEILSIISNQWLTFALAAFLAAMFLFGWRKGLVKMLFSLSGFFLSIALSRYLLPYVQNYLEEQKWIYTWIQQKAERFFYEKSTAYINESINSETNANGMFSEKIINGNSGNSAADTIYQLLGLDKMADFAADRIASLILTVLIFIFLLIISRLLLRIVFYMIDGIMHLPGLNAINRLSGAVVGLLEGILYIWVLILIIGILPENPLSLDLARQFNEPGSFPYYIKDANLLLRLIMTMLSINIK